MSTIIGGLDFSEDTAPSTPETHRTILGVVPTVLRLTPREDWRTLAEDIALVTNSPIMSCGWQVSPLSEYLLLERPGAKITMNATTRAYLSEYLLLERPGAKITVSPKTRADLIRELLG